VQPDEPISGVLWVPEEQLMRELQKWEAGLSSPPTLFDVVRTRRSDLLGAYVLRGFRAAAVGAVDSRRRVSLLRGLAGAVFQDPERVEAFLRASHPALGRTPLQAAVASLMDWSMQCGRCPRMSDGPPSAASS
jgi:hypothetical protein